MNKNLEFHNEAALLDRLSTALSLRPQEVIFLVGAPLSAPLFVGAPGVPDVSGMIDLIRKEFAADPRERDTLETELSRSGKRIYQNAFTFVQGRRGQRTANEIVCRAVLAARKDEHQLPAMNFANWLQVETVCRTLEADLLGWQLNPGTEALGRIISDFPDVFGKTVLTTNFDPLVEIAIQLSGGRFYKTILHADGNLGQTEAPGVHVVHLHGFWLGTDTLHTARQLGQPRPHLKDSLRSLLRNALVVACGYGGWDDVFTDALMDVVRDVNAVPEILWTFHASAPNADEDLIARLEPGIDRARVNLYSGIDCNLFFPRLYERWIKRHPKTAIASSPSNPVRASHAILQQIQTKVPEQVVIEGNDEDNPPSVEIFVGRERELHKITESKAKVILLTGIGGQGKSTIAATYYASCQSERRIRAWVAELLLARQHITLAYMFYRAAYMKWQQSGVRSLRAPPR